MLIRAANDVPPVECYHYYCYLLYTGRGAHREQVKNTKWHRLQFLLYFQGGEIVQETITSNVGEDIITLEFQRTDGTLVTELIDFRNVSREYKSDCGTIE